MISTAEWGKSPEILTVYILIEAFYFVSGGAEPTNVLKELRKCILGSQRAL